MNNTIEHVYFSMATVPPRFTHPSFLGHLQRLCAQLFEIAVENSPNVSCKLIVRLCKEYVRFPFSKENLSSLVAQWTACLVHPEMVEFQVCDRDLGPISKSLPPPFWGKYLSSRLLICMDDDWNYDLPRLFRAYTREFESLPGLNACFIPEASVAAATPRTIPKQFYGWLTYAFRGSAIQPLANFYHTVCHHVNPDFFFHDDAVVSAFVHLFLAPSTITCLSSCFPFHRNDPFVESLEKCAPLHETYDPAIQQKRRLLEKQIHCFIKNVQLKKN